MPFVLKNFDTTQYIGKKIQHFINDELGFSVAESQRLVCKGRVFDNKQNRLQMSQSIKSDFIQIALFEGVSRGLKPLFVTNDFAFFDKPSGVMVHPTSRNTQYSLLDEIRYHFGENANLGHRIDQETSGLVLITRNKYSDMILKEMFENKEYQKEYLAVVDGKIDSTLTIEEPLARDLQSSIGVKMKVTIDGKYSKTVIEPISYDPIKNQTLIKALPLTGRQHQIRVHLNYIGHTIIGDPIYGIDEKYADMYLCKTLDDETRIKITKHHRLMLHSNKLHFRYQGIEFKINSKLTLV
ncbi:MAG: RluA family pseudouridine synthase [Campylobacterales bacterium]|nr:RluA family pseudouridine synthase [Campylobacterales bacterium]